jgi:hypothetical protein
MDSTKRVLVQGVVAGALGASALALWFFAIDLIRNEPLYTPDFMARVLLGRIPGLSGTTGIIAFTILHFLSFALVGIAVAWLLQRTGIRPRILLGAVLGFLMFDIVFYVGVILGGANILTRLGWPQVLVGNFLAGLILMAYLRAKCEFPTTTWREQLAANRVIREAVISGLIGAGSIALWFLVLDLLRGRIFFTPAALGSALFVGTTRAADVQVTFGIVFGYTVIHVATFLLAGFVAATLLAQAEKHPPVLLGIVLLFVTFEVLFFGFLVIIANWLLEVLEWWTVLASNLIAAGAMGIYLLKKHPALRAELNKPLEEDEYLAAD